MDKLTDLSQPDADLHDPVCGMTVTAESEYSFKHEDHRHYFCSAHCLEKFRLAPEQYLDPGVPAQEPDLQQDARVYTCPMHPEVRQDDPGTCPKCGMALEPETPSLATRTQYTCPMHPEIVRDEPGECPKCGMALEAMTVSLDDEENPELVDMSRRFWISAVVTVPLVILAMGGVVGLSFEWLASPRVLSWAELVLATPVVLWGGWPFFVRGWQSVTNRRPSTSAIVSLVDTCIPSIFSLISFVASWV